MSRSEVRTAAAWRSFDLWATIIVPLLLVVPAVFGWLSGRAGACCSEGASPAVVAAPVAEPTPPPVAAPVESVTPPPAPVAASTPAVDCATITDGVTVPFATASAELTDEGKRALDATISCLNAGRYEVGGHTDSDGGAPANQRLSEARANAARAYLVSKGVAEDRLSARGFGETMPVADNATTAGKSRNRRITFTVR
ncbi:MAG: OmpA family protein [Gemmatimonadaceae bacterium]|nr:OmpA family protein [Gemmatimonadaceae bacterium]